MYNELSSNQMTIMTQKKVRRERGRGGRKDRVGRQEETKEGGKPQEMVRKL